MSVAATIEGQPKEVVRSYTPISSDENLGYFDLLIKSYPQGNISKHMSTLKLGQTLKVKGPKGAMVYTPGLVKRFGMIAGGTGITPMLQIIRAVVRGRPKNGGSDTTEVDLIFANVNYDDILLKDDLDNLAKEDPGFRVHYVLNNPPEKWDGGVGFCTPEMIKVSTYTAQRKSYECVLISPTATFAGTCQRHETPHVRSSAYDQCHEEGRRVNRLRQGSTSQQTRGPSLLLLINKSILSCSSHHTIPSSHPPI